MASQVQPAPHQAANNNGQEQITPECHIHQIRSACLRKDEEDGRLVKTALSVVNLVIGIFTGLAIGGVAGLLGAAATMAIVGTLLTTLHDHVRKREYKEIADELSTPAFSQAVRPTIHQASLASIRNAFNAYRRAQETAVI